MEPEEPSVRIAQDRFVLEWGRLSSSWGINRTMAQIHALLLITGREFSMDEIIERLHISRGNASMNLRDLMDWGLVLRVRRPGDRKDLYQCDGDILSMFARVIRERKRREIDPTVLAIQDCIDILPKDSSHAEVVVAEQRLTSLLEIFGIVDKVYTQLFGADSAYLEAVSRLTQGGRITAQPPAEETESPAR
jgi:HTH-type transcriptional regulator, glycine betaine synthesis regulator